ncbi:hypothetical protein [Deinococcus sp.]|uniref:hypothetical protein n=1 Tax=Deinococcus sp. TaxID=47478 RepID=UPI003C7BCF30
MVIQWIEVEWGKDARGAQAATRRNQLPTALPLPELVLKPETEIVVQRLSFSDVGNFEAPIIAVEESERLGLPRLPGIELELLPNQLVATLRQEMKWTDIYRPQIVVPMSTWSRLTWNERVSCEHTWRYKQTTLNIACLAPFSPSIFLDQPPISERADLRNLY